MKWAACGIFEGRWSTLTHGTEMAAVIISLSRIWRVPEGGLRQAEVSNWVLVP